LDVRETSAQLVRKVEPNLGKLTTAELTSGIYWEKKGRGKAGLSSTLEKDNIPLPRFVGRLSFLRKSKEDSRPTKGKKKNHRGKNTPYRTTDLRKAEEKTKSVLYLGGV